MAKKKAKPKPTKKKPAKKPGTGRRATVINGCVVTWSKAAEELLKEHQREEENYIRGGAIDSAQQNGRQQVTDEDVFNSVVENLAGQLRELEKDFPIIFDDLIQPFVNDRLPPPKTKPKKGSTITVKF